MEKHYRGYSITVEHRNFFHRVYVSPSKPWLPILHTNHFDWKGTSEQALAEAHRQIDSLLDWGWRK